MMTDPIADMLARIRNAGMAKHPELALPASNTKLAIARVLAEAGFLENVRIEAREGRATLSQVRRSRRRTSRMATTSRHRKASSHMRSSLDRPAGR
jgi:small subunit ribosomal protein S8